MAPKRLGPAVRKLISVVLSHQVRGNWLRRPQEMAAGKQAASRPRKDARGGGPAEGTREGAAGTRTPHLGRLSIQLLSPISVTQAHTAQPRQEPLRRAGDDPLLPPGRR